MSFLEIEEISNSPAFDLKVNVCNTKLSDKKIEKVGKKACVLQPGLLQGRAAKLLLVRRKSLCNENLVQLYLAANVRAQRPGLGFYCIRQLADGCLA